MGRTNDIILFLAGFFIVFVCILTLLLIIAVKRDHVKRFRVLAVLFALLGYTGIVLVILGTIQPFVPYL